MLDTKKKEGNGMNKFKTEISKAIVTQECEVYKKSDGYKKTIQDKEFSKEEKITIQILSVYNRIQMKLLAKEIEELRKENSVKRLLELLYDRSRDNICLEGELFQLARISEGDELIGDTMNSFCGMVSNENIELFEMIEKELTK